jgi:hypothetical protein
MADRILNASFSRLTRPLVERPDEVPGVLTMLKLVWLVGIPIALVGVLLAP